MRLLFISFLLMSALISLSQDDKKFFGRIAPGFTLPEKGDSYFSGYGTFGAVAKGKLTAGLSFGYLGVKSDTKPIAGGIEVGFLNFNAAKFTPTFSVGAYYLFYDSEITTSVVEGNVRTQTKVANDGKFHARIGGGVAYPFAKSRFISLNAYYSPLWVNSETTVTTILTGPGTPTSSTSKRSEVVNSNSFTISFEITL